MTEKIEIIRSWIEKGDHDLGTAQVTFLYIPKFRDTIAFHCQQAVEKYLKGYLFFKDTVFKRTHNLNYLLVWFLNLIQWKIIFMIRQQNLKIILLKFDTLIPVLI